MFSINTSIDNELQGEKGTELVIQKNSFVNENNELIDGEVTVKLIEALDSVDIAGTQVTMEYYKEDGTRTLFQSAGMYKVTAEYNNSPVFLAKEKISDPDNIRGKDIEVIVIYTDVIGSFKTKPDGYNFKIDTLQGVLARVMIIDAGCLE